MKLQSLIVVIAAAWSIAGHADEITGKWRLTVETPRGTQHPELTIWREGDGHAGTYKGRRGEIAIDSVATSGNAFSFPLTITMPMGEMEMSYEGVVVDDRVTGTIGNPMGQIPFEGVRVSPAERDAR
ncbi:MAG: hypothetical protein AAF515_13645 [Pseudomonadota bacterium]